MWGEDGNGVRPYQVETMLAIWSASGNVIRHIQGDLALQYFKSGFQFQQGLMAERQNPEPYGSGYLKTARKTKQFRRWSAED
jgi:hypothetical protein